MSDISTAPEQDAIAESLLGEPEESAQPEVTGTEPDAQSDESPGAEPEAQPDATPDDWLPSDQDKVFPDEVYAKYAGRYQLSPEQAADPLIRQLLHDKINTDIFVRQQQQAEDLFPQETEQLQPEPTQPQLTREQYFQNLDQIIQTRTDPQIAKEFTHGFLRAWGVPDDQIANFTPQQSMQFTTHMSKFALNLFNTFFPDMMQAQLGNHLNQSFPGFADMYERSAYAMAWDQVRNSNPQYGSLPAYGTKEFSQTLHEAEAKFPELMAAFEGQDGKIPPGQAARAYSILAKIASGQTVDPAIVQRAVATGQQQARRAAVRRSAGNLGSGQSKAGSGSQKSSQFQTNSDLFDDETMEIYQREHGRL